MIVRLAREHIDAVAALHCASLQGLLSALGLQAARAYYTGCIGAVSSVAFAYVEQDVVRGFVLGSARPSSLKSEVTRSNLARTIAALCVGIAKRPSALVWLLKSFRGPDEGGYDRDAAELIYLAVTADGRNSGIGRQLVEAFTEAMRAHGVHAYELSVDDDNEQAIGFYERLRFQLSGRYREFGKLHRRYRLEIAATPEPSHR